VIAAILHGVAPGMLPGDHVGLDARSPRPDNRSLPAPVPLKPAGRATVMRTAAGHGRRWKTLTA
jgi:hypothetical protein